VGGQVFRSEVSLDLDQPARHLRAPDLAHKHLAQQVARARHGIAIEEVLAEDGAIANGV
jgi:hypothetical protein